MRRRHGFTAMELTIVVSLSAIVVTLAAVSYQFVMRQTARVAEEAAVAIRVATMVERMAPTVEQAFTCSIYSLPNGFSALLCEMPDSTYGSYYAPYRIDAAGKDRFRAGERYVFYLSNSTGATTSTGNILWRARADAGSTSFVPEAGWALQYDSNHPHVSGFTYLSFFVDSTYHRVVVNANLSASYAASALGGQAVGGTKTVAVQREFNYRNYTP